MTRTDRKLVAVAGGVAVLIIASALLFAPAPDDENPVPSTYSSSSAGARASYLLLSELGYNVQRWEDTPQQLPLPGRGALLILAEPTDPPSNHDVENLYRFVSTGGRVLFCGPSIDEYFKTAEISSPITGAEWKQFTPSFPSYLIRDARKVMIQPKAYWQQLSPSQLGLYGDGDSVAVVDWSIGDGEVLWWAAATPLTNVGITQADNLNFFLNAVAGAGSERSQVLWDEYFHGQRRSLWNYFGATPLRWGLVQLALLAFGILFTFSRRSGPIVPAAVVSRLSPLEFVDTMGGLYGRAGAASVPVSVSYKRFHFDLARRLGLPVSTSNRELARVAGVRLGLPAGKLAETLESAAAAGEGVKLKPRRALELVQTLENYQSQLRSPQSIQEKN